MRKAYELKAKQAQEQLEAQEKNHFKQLHELLRKHKVRCLFSVDRPTSTF